MQPLEDSQFHAKSVAICPVVSSSIGGGASERRSGNFRRVTSWSLTSHYTSTSSALNRRTPTEHSC
eukprot:2362954-Amphidinium_carterae.1